MAEEYPKRTDPEAARLANALFGDGWLHPVATAIVGACGGYAMYEVAGVSGLILAETATGFMSGVVLYLRSRRSDEENTHLWVPMEYEDDED